METKICVFEKNNITFLLSKDNGMMINATEMAKPFGKKVEAFMRNEGTILFIEEALKSENSRFLGIENEENLYVSKQNSGTFMHRVLALKFAAWLSPKFELWVYSTIENLLFGKHVEREESFKRTNKLRDEREELRDKPNKTGDDFNRYIEIEAFLNREKAIRTSLTKEVVNEMKNLFEETEIP